MELRIFTEPQQGASYDDLRRVALKAEELGFGAFFRSDHYLTMGGDGRPGPSDAWTTLAALARELGGLGADVTELEDGLEIRPAPLHGGVFHTYADHRMAHAGVIIGAAVPGVVVEDIATTSKTFSDFAAFWAGLF